MRSLESTNPGSVRGDWPEEAGMFQRTGAAVGIHFAIDGWALPELQFEPRKGLEKSVRAFNHSNQLFNMRFSVPNDNRVCGWIGGYMAVFC